MEELLSNRVYQTKASVVYLMRCNLATHSQHVIQEVLLEMYRSATLGFLFYLNCTSGVINIFIHPHETLLKTTLEKNKGNKNVDVFKAVRDNARTRLLSYKCGQRGFLTVLKKKETRMLFADVDCVVNYCDRGGHVVNINLEQLYQLGNDKLCSWCPRLDSPVRNKERLPPPTESSLNDHCKKSKNNKIVRLKRVLRRTYEEVEAFPLYGFTTKTSQPVQATDHSSTTADNPDYLASVALPNGTSVSYRQRLASSSRKNHSSTSVVRGTRSEANHTPALTQYERAKHPEYLDRGARLMSYATWRYHTQDKTLLANNGFFYTGEGDLVRCCQCDLGLKDFNGTDDILKEHIRYSSDCEFLLNLLGYSLLEKKKRDIAVEDPLFAGYRLSEPNVQSTGFNPSSENTVIQRHRHPRRRTVEARLQTFTNWPRHVTQTPLQLAEAGLFYTGSEDIVRCWSCDGGLKAWRPEDDPWIEHCRWFPGCAYVRDTKGDQYIRTVLAAFEKDDEEHNPDQLLNAVGSLAIQDNNALPTNKSIQDMRNIHDAKTKQDDKTMYNGMETLNGSTMNSNTAHVYQQLQEMGYESYKISAAVKILVEQGQQSPDIGTVIDTIERTDSIHPSSSKSTSVPRTALVPAVSHVTAESLVNETERLRNMLICCQCRTDAVNVLFLPCQHHCVCFTCSEPMAQCPVCGAGIQHRIKTYM